MTASTRERSETETPTSHEPARRWWIVALVAVVALGLGVVLGTMLDGNNDTSDDVETQPSMEAPMTGPLQAIQDYNTAWEQNDPEALRAVVTDDFVEEYHWYRQFDGDVVVGGDDWDGGTAAAYARTSDYRIQVTGEAIVVGEGPWFITVKETQQGGGFEYDGTTTYVVVDDNGTFKLVLKSWHGTRE